MRLPSRDRLLLAALLVTAAIVSMRGLGDTSVGFPDADRILMDGVFIHDFLVGFEWSHPFETASRYYAQYPALSIGYRPPGYPLLIALSQLVLGVNMWSARLVELALWLVALTLWFRLLRRNFETSIAATSGLLLATTPYLAQWAWFTMSELPALSWGLIAVALWHEYLEDGRPRLAIFTSLALVAAVWTKQTAVVLVVWFLLEGLVRRRFALFRRREILAAFALGTLLLLPIAAMTLSFDDYNLEQSLGIDSEEAEGYVDEDRDPRLSVGHFLKPLRFLVEKHLSLPLLVLALVGMLSALRRRDEKAGFFALGVVAVYGFFVLLVVQDPRYTILWIPLLTLFAAAGAATIARARPELERLFPLAILMLTGWQVIQVYRMPQGRATGYDETARYVLEHSESPVVMFDGYNNGYFTYFMRSLDPERSMWVVRGDKVLTSSAIQSWNALEIHAEDTEDIDEILERLGVEYIVVEKHEISGLEIHQVLRSYLEAGPFAPELEIAVEGERRFLEGQSLLVYRYLNADRPRATTIEIPVPVVGTTIVAPWPSER